MSKEQQHTKLVPELRFPEFLEDGEWEIKSIEKNIDMISGIALKSDELTEDKSGTPILRGVNITEGRIRHSKEMDKFYLGDTSEINKYLVAENDIVIGMDGSKVGKNVSLISKFDVNSILIQRVARIRPIDSDIEFLYQNFISQRFRTYVDNVNTSSGIPHISAKQIRDYKIGFPPLIKEQQKIAACLSTLDQLITAETEKLSTLKDHKKGLLQQLFPANGETVPKLRFPEFVQDGDWEETSLEQLADYENGKAHEKEISENGKYKVVNSKFISTDGEVVKYTNSANLKARIGDILMVLSDVPNGKAIAKCFFVDKNDTYTVNQRICKITPTNTDNKFLFYILNRNAYFLNFDDGVKQTNLKKDDVLNFPLLKPSNPKEQQKIANTLTAVDELITTQTEKIEALKDHKKGLMQGMFPKIKN